MIKTNQKRLLAMFLIMALFACNVVTGLSFRSSAADGVVYKENSILATLDVTEADSTPVSTFAEFKAAVESGKAAKLTADITATGNLGSTSKYIDSDIVVFGGGNTLDMGAYQFLLTGSHTIYLSDLTVDTASTNSTHRYGLFCLRAGSATSSNYVWETGFHNLTYKGSALLGTYNTDDYTSTKRMFHSANFSGDTYINITNGYNGYNGVVYARNINISGKFDMEDNITTTNTGANSSTYQHYFKSAGTGGVDSEADNKVAYGVFNVEEGARVNITRSPGRGTDGATSAYYRSLIYGYADHNFGEGSSFYAKAGTNLTSSSTLLYRSAVIRSNNASSFVVGKNADVRLETDLYNTTASAATNGSYGFTALSLKKSDHLDILVDSGATLDIYADGRNTSPSYGTRAQAPVVIWGSGSSETTVFGNLNVRSENGNGWYYEYSTSKSGKASFIVESTGRVDILANNLGAQGAHEYAAFEAYGKYDVEIVVRGGGKMSVFSNGYRGMSLASSSGYNQKSILVTGAGSELSISGVHWAIAAETQPILTIAAENGGKIDLLTRGEVNDGYSASGSAPSTVYSVGPTTYRVDGADSEMNIHHNGGTYSAIFHDGYGPLNIEVTNGGAMDVYNRNSGSDTSARRAAITAQSTYLSTYKSYDNLIRVDGAGSSLNVVNENPLTHGNGGDTGLYPTGAVSFNSSAKGNIIVSDGGEFTAVSSSLAPTIHLYQGSILFDDPGEFEIRNNALSSSTGNHNTYATFGQAVYNERYRKGTGGYNTAIEFINCDVDVWSVLENDYDYAEQYRDNSWSAITATADNQSIQALDKNGTGGDTELALNQFDLSAYGRINGVGESYGGSKIEISAPPVFNTVYSGDRTVSGEGVTGSLITVTFPSGNIATAIVDANGTWSVDCPGENLSVGDTITATQFEFGKLISEKAQTVVQVRPTMSPAAQVDDLYEGDAELSGSGVAKATITVVFPSGNKTTAQVGQVNPEWSVSTAGEELVAGDVIRVYQTVSGNTISEAVEVIVLPDADTLPDAGEEEDEEPAPDIDSDIDDESDAEPGDEIDAEVPGESDDSDDASEESEERFEQPDADDEESADEASFSADDDDPDDQDDSDNTDDEQD